MIPILRVFYKSRFFEKANYSIEQVKAFQNKKKFNSKILFAESQGIIEDISYFKPSLNLRQLGFIGILIKEEKTEIFEIKKQKNLWMISPNKKVTFEKGTFHIFHEEQAFHSAQPKLPSHKLGELSKKQNLRFLRCFKNDHRERTYHEIDMVFEHFGYWYEDSCKIELPDKHSFPNSFHKELNYRKRLY